MTTEMSNQATSPPLSKKVQAYHEAMEIVWKVKGKLLDNVATVNGYVKSIAASLNGQAENFKGAAEIKAWRYDQKLPQNLVTLKAFLHELGIHENATGSAPEVLEKIEKAYKAIPEEGIEAHKYEGRGNGFVARLNGNGGSLLKVSGSGGYEAGEPVHDALAIAKREHPEIEMLEGRRLPTRYDELPPKELKHYIGKY
jgi:hypothetical protein